MNHPKKMNEKGNKPARTKKYQVIDLLVRNDEKETLVDEWLITKVNRFANYKRQKILNFAFLKGDYK